MSSKFMANIIVNIRFNALYFGFLRLEDLHEKIVMETMGMLPLVKTNL